MVNSILRLIGLVVLLSGCRVERFIERPDPLMVADRFIVSSDARTHIDFLASDSLMGRRTPSAGLEAAGEYIAREFQSYGLLPVNGKYFQEFNLSRVKLGEVNVLKVSTGERGKAYRIKRDFMPFEFTASKSVEGLVVFAGYGITAPEFEYDDYAHIDVRGKIVLVLRHEPQEGDSTSIFLGTKPTEHSKVRVKVDNAIDHGAVGMLLVNDPLNHRSLVPRGFPWPSLYKNIPEDALPLTLAMPEENKIPALHVGPAVIKQLLGSVDSLKSLERWIDSTLQPRSLVLTEHTVLMRTSTSATHVPTRNVVGIIRGVDPSVGDEVVIIGAHYDHVGAMQDHKEGEDYIFNGADDNASGATGVLQVAKAFGMGNPPPRRSILCIAFAGEELGLLGSRAYIQEPIVPLEKTVAMLNLDMVGRNAPDTVSVGGIMRSPDLKAITERANDNIGLTIRYDIEKEISRSDQASFLRMKIPVLFYHTGEHADYHRVTDHADKIDTIKLSKISRLVFLTAWEIAMSSARPAYQEAK